MQRNASKCPVEKIVIKTNNFQENVGFFFLPFLMQQTEMTESLLLFLVSSLPQSSDRPTANYRMLRLNMLTMALFSC